METKKSDYLNIRQWADEQADKMRATIREYIVAGIDRKKAVEMVLTGSTLGAGYAAQIRYEFIGFSIGGK